MKKKICIVTEGFPIVEGLEQYLAAEIPFLAQEFEIDWIVDLNGKQGVEDKNGVRQFVRKNSFMFKIYAMLSRFFWLGELKNIQKNGGVSLVKLRASIDYLAYALEFSNFVSNHHSKYDAFYTYWITPKTLGLSILNVPVVTRAHAFDVYFERHKGDFLPFRPFIFSKVRLTSFISKQGFHYSKNKGFASRNYSINYLGVTGPSNVNLLAVKSKIIHLVSCSKVIPLKQLDLIVAFLEETELSIKWTHIGDNFENIKKISEDRLSMRSNVSFDFLGYLSNEKVKIWYSNNSIDLFLNVSKTEGVPVSIMEANSFSIPSIAPNIGGISELQIHQENFLLRSNKILEDLIKAINFYDSLSLEKINELRTDFHLNWKVKFNAEINYKIFAGQIKSSISKVDL